ncbi:MAG: GGDEF domain-containing protein [Pseudomonadota bacterium]
MSASFRIGLDPAALIEQARSLNRHGDPAAALALGERALAAAAVAGDALGAARAGDCLVRSHFYLGRLDLALKCSYAALEDWQRCEQPVDHANARAMHSLLLSELGQTDDALEHGHAACRLAEATGDSSARAWAANTLGVAHRTSQQFDRAIDRLDYAVTCARQSGDEELLARCLGNLGTVHAYQADRFSAQDDAGRAHECFARALALHRECLALMRALGYRHHVATSLVNICRDLTGLGDFIAAQAAIEEQLAFSRSIGDQRGEAYGLITLGLLELARGRPQAGRDALAAALSLSQEIRAQPYAMKCELHLSEACERTGDVAAALQHHKRYHALFAAVASETAQLRSQAVAVQLETERAKAAAESERLRAEHLERSNLELTREAEHRSRQALQDTLTGLSNRRHLDESLQAAFDAGERFSLALLDVDHFKQVNDRFSHLVGDRVLQEIGVLLRQGTRQGDLCARYGGEEFALLVRSADPALAASACERLRGAIEAAPWSEIQPGLKVTVSIGLAHRDEVQVRNRLVALADERLYRAKGCGRNQTVAA